MSGSIRVLLASTALGAVLHGAAHANVYIDGGTTETVNGNNTGTQTSPWAAGTNLVVGDSGTGALEVSEGGAVLDRYGYVGFGPSSVGTVTVTGRSSIWSHELDLVLGYQGKGTIIVANDGAVVVTRYFLIAPSAGSTGTLFIGSGSKADPVAPGTLDAPTVMFGSGMGSIYFNHTGNDYEFKPGISGYGRIYQLAGITKLTGNSSGFTGLAEIYGGSLLINGAFGGTVNVYGGKFGGSGTFGGALTINSGGTFAPGNSIGTTSVGSATFGFGSIFEVELKSGGFSAGVHNDLLDATGAVTIDSGATVHVKPENGSDDGSTYTPGTYTIIAAAGGVTGTFGAVTDDFAFLNFALGYEANNVYLRSALAATSFCVTGMTANQCAAGDGVFSLGSGGLYTAVMNLSGAAAPGALDQLSGEIHASTQTVLVDDSRFARDVTTGRTRASFGGVGSVTLPMLAYAGGSDPLAVSTDPDRMAVWGQAFGALRSWTGAGATAMTGAAGGLLAGADAALSDTVRVGLFGGYAHSGFSNTGLASTGSAGSWQFGVYGGGQWDGFGLRGGASYAWHRINTSRTVAFPGFTDTLVAGYNAATAQVFAETGYRFDIARASFEPYGALAHVNVATRGFTETGGAAALTTAPSTFTATFTTLGLRAETDIDIGDTRKAKLTGGVGWRHAFGALVPATAATFAGGGAFTVTGVPVARDALVVDLGADVDMGATTRLGFHYSGQIAAGASDHSFKANLAARF